MNGLPNQFQQVASWVKKAEDDFRSAEYLSSMDEDTPFEVICFHAQQCAEKYIKALLLWLKIDFPKTHDLMILIRLIPTEFALAINMEELAPLNRCSIEPRYPGEWDSFLEDDAAEAMAISRAVRKEVRKRLPEESL